MVDAYGKLQHRKHLDVTIESSALSLNQAVAIRLFWREAGLRDCCAAAAAAVTLADTAVELIHYSPSARCASLKNAVIQA